MPKPFPIPPPIPPMLAKAVDTLPQGADFLYEPKWDGLRAIVFRSADEVFIQSRDLRPFDRYFPDLHDAFLKNLPPDCVLDGEIIIATKDGLDFDALQLRLHPAESRVAMLSKSMPASFVAFDLLAVGGRDLRAEPLHERRRQLEKLLRRPPKAGHYQLSEPIHVTAATSDRAVAEDWLQRFE